MSPDSCQKALQERIPFQWFEELTRRLAADDPVEPRALLPAAFDPVDDLQALQLWTPYLEQRKANLAEPTSSQQQEYRKRVLDDRRHGLNSMHMTAPRVLRGEDVSNDIALPPAPKYHADGSVDLAGRVQHWMKFNSWGVCAGCNILIPRKLTPSSLQRTLDPK
eukprot:5593583-Karenia_brevis.AAC.1